MELKSIFLHIVICYYMYNWIKFLTGVSYFTFLDLATQKQPQQRFVCFRRYRLCGGVENEPLPVQKKTHLGNGSLKRNGINNTYTGDIKFQTYLAFLRSLSFDNNNRLLNQSRNETCLINLFFQII
jgi:hypothetical protein